MDAIEHSDDLSLLERPECKRRWHSDGWDTMESDDGRVPADGASGRRRNDRRLAGLVGELTVSSRELAAMCSAQVVAEKGTACAASGPGQRWPADSWENNGFASINI
nr:hypothetical protein [Frankia sp. CiP3]